MKRSALLSTDQLYRYRLDRRWSPACGTVCWVMLNPSTADAERDDPTVRKCVRFSQLWGYGGLVVVNLFGLRTPSPEAMKRASSPYGDQNDDRLAEACAEAELVVAAWGVHGAHRNRAMLVLRSVIPPDVTVWRLGAPTGGGQPGHPLYVPYETPLELHRSPTRVPA